MEDIKYLFGIISCAVFIPIGFIGNIISIVIFSNSKFRKQPVAVYLIIVSIINLAAIFQLPNQLMLHYWTFVTDWDLACRFSAGIFIFTKQVDTWILCLSSFDRMVTVIAPMKFQFKDTKTFQIVSVILICVINAVADVPIFHSLKNYDLPNNISMCSFPLEPDFSWFSKYAQYSLTIVGCGVAFLIMITSSVLIVWTLWKSKSKFSRGKSFQKELNLTRSLLLMDAFFFITALPMDIYAYLHFLDPFIYQILYVLSNLYNVFMFVIFFCSNKLYRTSFCNLFLNCFSKKF